MSTPPLTAARAARHEALQIRLSALLKQVEAVARQKPSAALLPVVRSLAEDLLFEAQQFRPRGQRRGLFAAAPDYAGLAAQLDQALAMLGLFEDANSGWDPNRGYRVWCLADGSLTPISRYNPQPRPVKVERSEPEIREMRRKLERHIMHREMRVFEAGRRAAEGGVPYDEAVAGMYPPRILIRTWAARQFGATD